MVTWRKIKGLGAGVRGLLGIGRGRKRGRVGHIWGRVGLTGSTRAWLDGGIGRDIGAGVGMGFGIGVATRRAGRIVTGDISGMVATLRLMVLIVIFSGAITGCDPTGYSIEVKQPSIGLCNETEIAVLLRPFAGELRPGRHRQLVMQTLSEIAVEVWKNTAPLNGSCQSHFSISYPDIGAAQSTRFVSELSFYRDGESVCIGHDDFLGLTPGLGPEREAAYLEYDWGYVSDPIGSLSDYGLRRKRFLPACFDSEGKLEGYRSEW